jgi:hypothetical protein
MVRVVFLAPYQLPVVAVVVLAALAGRLQGSLVVVVVAVVPARAGQ